ncbi:MAG: hydrogenase 4 subunit F [Candidatus Omnitrophota bacterium]
MMPLSLVFIFGIPAALTVLGLFVRTSRPLGIAHNAGYLSVLCAAGILFKEVLFQGPCVVRDFLYVDVLSAFFILVTAVISFAASLYSTGYVKKDTGEGVISEQKARVYYTLFNLFCFSMFFCPALNNLGLLWVAVEMTTLVSAFLVGFYNKKESVEAAWKYIIICSVGIIFALLGTILFAYAYSLTGAKTLAWTDMMALAQGLDPRVLKIAFIFILVGYGTKAGLAPMHTWLPDAHSQAVAPISALLSGVLLKTAFYAILRFGMILIKAGELAYFSHLMMFFGLISLVISCGFILVQKDVKRLLAYSSIEHIGLVAVSFGLATPLAFAAGLFHVFNHAVTKAFMFFGAGNIVHAYKKRNMNSIKGVMRLLPFTGVMTLLGVFALGGFPPFSVFASEFLVLAAAFANGSYAVGGCLLLFLGLVFAAFLHHFAKMLYGHLPKGAQAQGEPLSGKAAFIFLFILMLAAGAAFAFVKEDALWITKKLFQI